MSHCSWLYPQDGLPPEHGTVPTHHIYIPSPALPPRPQPAVMPAPPPRPSPWSFRAAVPESTGQTEATASGRGLSAAATY